MSAGKLLAGGIVVTALVAGVAMYWLQVYAYYDRVDLAAGDLTLVPYVTGVPEPIPAEDVEAINADSSPLRFRACFTTPLSQAMLTETYVLYDDAVPLIAPGWFSCFDAEEIGDALTSGEALAFLGEKNIAFGIDRVIAVFGDGRGFAWHQVNHCGDKAYDGTQVGEDCPPREE